MSEHVFVGFGFGPIQAGPFAKEAFESTNLRRIVVAEIDAALVAAVRAGGGSYNVNVARARGIEHIQVDGVELLNPTDPKDAAALRHALTEATEIATCLPSVSIYDAGGGDSVAAVVADGLRRRKGGAAIVYAAENNNHAAEILQETVSQRLGGALPARVQFLNTVIGKMSRVVTEPAEIAERGLAPMAAGIDRAFLVEQFNRILVSKTTIAGFNPGIDVFIEKGDLLPFEEAKLYGHNAIHALLGFAGSLRGYVKMTEIESDESLMSAARDAFIAESGGALVEKYASLGDALFTEAGYRRYAEDLLERMTNPYLGDTVARAARDVGRKLGPHDRIFGTMTLALEHGIEPRNMAIGAMAGVALMLENPTEYDLPDSLTQRSWRDISADDLSRLLTWVWQGKTSPHIQTLIDLTYRARTPLIKLLAE
jgi:mannitol-1-phosphate 5-dehydrogenase